MQCETQRQFNIRLLTSLLALSEILKCATKTGSVLCKCEHLAMLAICPFYQSHFCDEDQIAST